MKVQIHPLFWLACSIALSSLAATNPTQAQIASDRTTPSNITQLGNVLEITGGKEADHNLFYSFTEFSVRNGDVARFVNNNAAIRNVIKRVTGSSTSEIFGMLEAGGSASNFNLFLLNPNGIIFGPNASLKSAMKPATAFKVLAGPGADPPPNPWCRFRPQMCR